MRFLIVGAGAVGGFAAARLADGGHGVTLLVRPRSAARLRDGGLRIANQDGVRVVRPSVVTAGELSSGYDATVLAVKSEDLGGVMADIEPAVKPSAVIVPRARGHRRRHVGQMGLYSEHRRRHVADAGASRRDRGGARGGRFARAVAAEAAAAAAACGHPVPAGQLRLTGDALTAAGSSTTSSLSRDLIAGRRTEVEAVPADLAARASAAGTATPLIDLAVLALRIHNRQIGSQPSPGRT